MTVSECKVIVRGLSVHISLQWSNRYPSVGEAKKSAVESVQDGVFNIVTTPLDVSADKTEKMKGLIS
jgi:hypothetical protein